MYNRIEVYAIARKKLSAKILLCLQHSYIYVCMNYVCMYVQVVMCVCMYKFPKWIILGIPWKQTFNINIQDMQMKL